MAHLSYKRHVDRKTHLVGGFKASAHMNLSEFIHLWKLSQAGIGHKLHGIQQAKISF